MMLDPLYMIVIGIMMGAGAHAAEGSDLGLWLVKAGLLLFGAVAVFQLVTLPVEFNASRRAKAAMAGDGILTGPDEASCADAMLRAAAMTYVAALVTTLMWLLYYAMRAGLLGGRRNNWSPIKIGRSMRNSCLCDDLRRWETGKTPHESALYYSGGGLAVPWRIYPFLYAAKSV